MPSVSYRIWIQRCSTCRTWSLERPRRRTDRRSAAALLQPPTSCRPPRGHSSRKISGIFAVANGLPIWLQRQSFRPHHDSAHCSRPQGSLLGMNYGLQARTEAYIATTCPRPYTGGYYSAAPTKARSSAASSPRATVVTCSLANCPNVVDGRSYSKTPSPASLS
jgi:hypothetical protein